MTATLEHIVEADLAAYAATGQPDDPAFAPVRAHLSTGCGRCRSLLQRYRAARPSDGRRVVPSVAEWLIPQTVRFRRDQRAGMLADVQLVCGVGDFELDVFVCEREGPLRLDINGQITRAGSIHDPVADLQLSLVEPEAPSVVDGTATDRFGEFGFASLSERPYGLRLGTAADAPCVLVWEGD